VPFAARGRGQPCRWSSFSGNPRIAASGDFFVWGTVVFGAFRRCETSLVSRLQTCSFSRLAIGITRKLIAANSLIEKPCLYGLGCHPFRDLADSGRSPSIIGRRLRRYLSAPSPKKRLLPFHVGLPWSAVVSGFGPSR
jgi:hypothetical protein